MRRVLALAAAVAMIAAALILRDRMDDDGGSGGGDGGNAGGGDGRPELVVCATELAAACEELARDGIEVRVEPAGVTADALIAGASDLDGWLTIAPWPAMVDGALSRNGRPIAFEEPEPAPLARTPVVLVGVAERMAALRELCGGDDPYWRCIGDHVGAAVRPAHDPADQSATGLLVIASAVTDFFGAVPTASNEFQEPEFQSWFTRLERATTFTTNFDSLIQHLLVRPSTFDAVGALEAPALAAGARRDGYSILYPSPMATADAVLVWARGEETDRFDDAVRRVLVEGEWRRADDPDLRPANELPGPGVMEALRALWQDVA